MSEYAYQGASGDCVVLPLSRQNGIHLFLVRQRSSVGLVRVDVLNQTVTATPYIDLGEGGHEALAHSVDPSAEAT